MGEIGRILTTYVNDVSEAETWHGTHTAVLRGQLDEEIAKGFFPSFEKVALAAPGVYALRDSSDDERWVMNGGRAHIVTEGYPIMQHDQMLSLPENVAEMVEDGTAGYFGNGEIAFRQWNLKNGFFEPVKGDAVDMRFMLTNPHDGSSKFRGGLCSERVVCRNTHMVAEREIYGKDDSGKVSLKKTKFAQSRYDSGITDTISDIIAYAVHFQEFAKQLAKTPSTDEGFETLVRIAFPDKINKAGEDKTHTKTKNKRDKLRELRAPGEFAAMGVNEIPGVEGTLWGDLNVFSEYMTHWQTTRVVGDYSDVQKDDIAQEQRIKRTWSGPSRVTMDKITAKLMEMVA